MKWLVCITLFLAMAFPAWAEKEITVQQLKERLLSLQQNKKSDLDTAYRLKDLQLTEQLTPATLHNLLSLSPGRLTATSIYALEARSAMLTPPSSELPALPTPDIAAQKIIIGRVVDYVVKNYMQNPRMSASKTIFSFPRLTPGVVAENTQSVGNLADNLSVADVLPSHTETVDFEKEIETDPVLPYSTELKRFLTPLSPAGAGPVLSLIFQQAAEANNLTWQRWESIGAIDAAVFSFSVDKSRSLYRVELCCTADQSEPVFANGTAFNGTQTYHDKKARVGYHGELFIDPRTGSILRLVLQPVLSPSGYTHREDSRVDYGPVDIAGRTYIVPIRAFTIRELVSSMGDYYKFSYHAGILLRRDEYANYRLAAEQTQAQR